MKDRDENCANDDEREGEPEIVLYETHPAFVGLARRGKESDRARLRGHDREADRSPANGLVAMQIMAEIVITSRAPVSIKRDREQRADEYDIIDPAHEK